MEHKAGDKVKVKSLEWLDQQIKIEDDEHGWSIESKKDYFFVEDMLPYFGQEMTIEAKHFDLYHCEEDEGRFGWTDEMFE